MLKARAIPHSFFPHTQIQTTNLWNGLIQLLMQTLLLWVIHQGAWYNWIISSLRISFKSEQKRYCNWIIPHIINIESNWLKSDKPDRVSENGLKVSLCFGSPMMSSNVLFHSRPKDIPLTVIEDQIIFTFTKLETDRNHQTQNDESIIKRAGDSCRSWQPALKNT